MVDWGGASFASRSGPARLVEVLDPGARLAVKRATDPRVSTFIPPRFPDDPARDAKAAAPTTVLWVGSP